MQAGDAYYDLGKIYHALIINGSYIMKEHYSVEYSENEAVLEFSIRSNLLANLKSLKIFCEENKLCWFNVQLIGILNYINISPLYEYFKDGTYGEFLFLFGKLLLTKHFKGEELF